MHVVEPMQVGANQREPIQPPGNILRRFTFNRLIKLLGYLFYPLYKAFDKASFVLFFNLALEVDVDKEISGFSRNVLVQILNCNRPKSVDAEQFLEVYNVDNLEGACLGVVVNVTMLGIDIEEEHEKRSKAFNAQLCAVQLFAIAHNLLKNVCPTSLIQQELAFTTHGSIILLREEVEKDFLLVIADALHYHSLEEQRNVGEGQVSIFGAADQELNEGHKAVYVLTMCIVVPKQFQVLRSSRFFNRRSAS